MNAKERLIESLAELEPEAVLWLYDMALGLRRDAARPVDLAKRRNGMARCRRALADLPGSLAEELMRDREDRL